MYKLPIEVIYGEMQMKVENDIYKAVQNVGVNVDKEELLKALEHDRGQYDEGYADGYQKAVDEFAERCKGSVVCKLIGLRAIDIDFIAERMKGGKE